MNERSIRQGFIIVVVISLLGNVYLGVSLNRLRNELVSLSSMLSNQMNTLYSNVGSINSQINQMTRAQEWYSTPRIEVLEPGEKRLLASVVATWVFRELAAGAQVGVNYRVGSGEWKQAEIRHAGGLTYEAHMAVEVDLTKPVWWLNYSSSSAERTDSRVVVAESIASSGLRLEYVIHADLPDRRMSGDIETIDVSKIAGLFEVDVKRSSENSYSVGVIYRSPPGIHADVQQIRLLALGLPESSVPLASAVLKRQPNLANAWSGSLEAAGARRLLLQVHYTTGEVASIDVDAR